MRISYKLEGRQISRKSLNQILGCGAVDKFTNAVIANFNYEKEKDDEHSQIIRFRQQEKINTYMVQCTIAV
jgi:hypothetical protein